MIATELLPAAVSVIVPLREVSESIAVNAVITNGTVPVPLVGATLSQSDPLVTLAVHATSALTVIVSALPAGCAKVILLDETSKEESCVITSVSLLVYAEDTITVSCLADVFGFVEFSVITIVPLPVPDVTESVMRLLVVLAVHAQIDVMLMVSFTPEALLTAVLLSAAEKVLSTHPLEVVSAKFFSVPLEPHASYAVVPLPSLNFQYPASPLSLPVSISVIYPPSWLALRAIFLHPLFR